MTEKKYRAIQTYVLRASRITKAQKNNYLLYEKEWCIPYSENFLNFTEIFGNTNFVTIEIGFGMGDATAHIARNNPDKNYIGIEVHKSGVGKLLGLIHEQGLQNLRIIEHDAIEVLEHMIAPETVEAFHVFFPDPWHKTKHNKRRLLHRPRTDLLASRLALGGIIYMVTDWQDYAEDAFNELAQTGGLKSDYQKFAPSQEWRPRTRFEEKGIAKDHRITDVIFRKV